MKLRGGRTLAAAVVAASAGLSGCWESTDVTVHEPGEYKGMKDPLVESKSAAAREETLQQRFQMVQTDR